jgi:hypothetical protein
MRYVEQLGFFVLLSITIAAGAVTAARQSSTSSVSKQKSGAQSSETSKEDQIARGKYLVEQVARCPDCHTPRDSNGELDRSHWLQGASVWIMPVRSKQAWAAHAPALAGFPYSDQQGQDVLERGIGTNGIPLQPPMHVYNLHHDDALAIIAYLRSLRPHR